MGPAQVGQAGSVAVTERAEGEEHEAKNDGGD